MNPRSISFRLVAWYAGLLAVIFLLLCALLYLDLRHFLENDLRQSQFRRTRQIANTLLAHVKQTGEPYVASQTKDWYEPEINDRFIRITRADGTLVYVSGRAQGRQFRSGGSSHFSAVVQNGIFAQAEIVGRQHPAHRRAEFQIVRQSGLPRGIRRAAWIRWKRC